MAIARDKGASSRYSGITKHKTPYAQKAKIMLKVALLERPKKNKKIIASIPNKNGLSANDTPMNVAIPLPPFPFNQIGYRCPMMTKNAAIEITKIEKSK